MKFMKVFFKVSLSEVTYFLEFKIFLSFTLEIEIFQIILEIDK